jgi:hypothetical protein
MAKEVVRARLPARTHARTHTHTHTHTQVAANTNASAKKLVQMGNISAQKFKKAVHKSFIAKQR